MNPKPSLVELIDSNLSKFADNVFLKEKVNGEWTETTYAECRVIINRIGAGLMALGVEKNDHISFISEGRNLWVLAEMGLLSAGAVNVPISIKLAESADLQFRVSHSESKWIICSGQQLGKIRNILPQCPLVEKVIVFDKVEDMRENEIFIEDVMKMGDKLLEETPDALEQRKATITNDDIATICYTSGTTADPKGVLLTQRNYAANVAQAMTHIYIYPHETMLLILPLDHCYAHVAGFYIIMTCGASLATVPAGRNGIETLRNIPIAIREVKPHCMLSVPALAKSFKGNIETTIKAKGPTVVKLYNFALRLAISYNKEAYNKGGFWQLWKKPIIALFDKLIFSQVREGLGGNMRFFSGGGAYLDPDLQRYYLAIGIPIYQGYGLSEATPIISTNGPADYVLGSTGLPAYPIDVAIMDDALNVLPQGQRGEICIKGENVMAGYWKNPEATAKTIIDGWLHTGDMGYLDETGHLYVEGRFKSLLIGADGEKYSPEGIEENMEENLSTVEQVVLHDSQDPYVIALIVPSIPALKAYMAKKYPDVDLASDEAKELCLKKLHADISEYRKGGKFAGLFPERWLPSVFAVLPEPFTEQNHMVNSTMKVVRGKVEEAYKDRIALAYTPEGKNPVNAKNMESLNLK